MVVDICQALRTVPGTSAALWAYILDYVSRLYMLFGYGRIHEVLEYSASYPDNDMKTEEIRRY